jgi:FkbM family methyltransferase
MMPEQIAAADEHDAHIDPEELSVRKQFKLLLSQLETMPGAARARLQGHLTQVLIDRPVTIETPRGPISFVALGRTGAGRGVRMLTKQPATIEWIDRFDPGSVFWDIGANVGVYTLYAARRGDTSVVAFEPAAVNYYLLAANCEVNGFDDRVQCLLAGIGAGKAIARLEVSQFATAQSFSFHGKKHRPYGGRQAAFIVSIDELVEDYGLPCPNYIKLDVPGVTHDILSGGERTLQRPEVKEVHIEANDASKGGRRIIDVLNRSGLVLAGSNTHGSTDLTFARQGA